MSDFIQNLRMDQMCFDLPEQCTGSDYDLFEKSAQNKDYNSFDLPDFITNQDLSGADEIDKILNELVDQEMPIAQPLSPNIVTMNERVTVLSNHQSPNLWVDQMKLTSEGTAPSTYMFSAPAVYENDTNDIDVGGNEEIEAEDPMMAVIQVEDAVDVIELANNETAFLEISEEFTIDDIQTESSYHDLKWQTIEIDALNDQYSTSVPDISQEETVETEEMILEQVDSEGSTANDSGYSTCAFSRASSISDHQVVSVTSTRHRGRPRKPVEVQKRPGQKLTKVELNNIASRKHRHKKSDKKKLLSVELEKEGKLNERLTRKNKRLAAVIHLLEKLLF